MAKQEELEIEIDALGQVQVHVTGRKGKACLDYVKIFEEMLGPVAKQDLTDEYYEVDTHIHIHERQTRG